MTITVAFERWELEFLTDCIAADHDCADILLLREKLVATRDLMRRQEAAQIEHEARQRTLWESWEIIKRREP